MPTRLVLGILATVLAVWFSGCSSGLGNNLPNDGVPTTAASSNQPVGFDLGVTLTSPPVQPAVAGLVIPPIGATPQREIVLLGFATVAAADDADGSGTDLSRDAVTDTNAASDVFVAAICAQDIETRAFSQSLAGKFRHPRCTTCHSMQAATTTAFVSATAIGFPHQGPPPGPTFPNNDPATCVPCHVTSTLFPVPTWQAPAASFDMRTDTVVQLVDRANRIPAGDLEHFVSDARVLWALDSGILPQVGGNNGVADDDQDGIDEPEDRDGTPRTVPGGSVNFLREIEEWIASGRQVSAGVPAVKDVTLASRATGGTAAPNGASSRPKLLWVPNATFNPTSSATAAASNPIGTLVVVYESTAGNIAGTDGNGVSDVFRATFALRAEQDPVTGAASTGGLNLVYVSTELVSAVDVTTTAGNGASTNASVGGATGEVVAFQSLAIDLVTGITDGNGASDVFVRRTTTNATVLLSQSTGGAQTGDGASDSPSLDATGVAIAFSSAATDVVAGDTNAARDVFHARVDTGAPFTRVRSSVTATGAEGTGGASTAPTVHVTGAGRIRVAFESTMTNLAPSLTAASNVFLFDSATGFTTLLNQRVSAVSSAVGDGSARGPVITSDGSAVVFESDATNIDVLRANDDNNATDIFVVETAQVASGKVLPFRISMTAADAGDANGSSTGVVAGSFTGSTLFPVGFVAYTTAATNLGTADGTNLMVSFLSETSGVLADFTATPLRGTAPLTVNFTDTSTGGPTSWQWDFTNDGTIDSTEQNPAGVVYATPGVFTVRLVARNELSDSERIQTGLIIAVATPDADFTASATSGVAPLTVDFTDTSTQSPTGWQWDFTNDGTIDSTDQNPTGVSYATPGTFDVRLVVTNEAGSATETKTGLVTVFAPVVASFTRTPASGVAPLQVDFTNASTGATSFSWDFDEDGIADSTATNPSFVYNSAGTFDVTLTATGPGGTDTFTFVNCVDVFGAVAASFTMTVAGNPITSAYEATNITFTSTSTGTITTTSWDFDFVANPGSLTATGSPVVRNFAATTATTRSFVVRLSVSGPGGSANTQQTLTIVSDTETQTFNPDIDTTIYENLTGNGNGAGTGMVVGRPAGTISAGSAAFARRGLMRFNLGTIPANSTVNSSSLQIVSDTPVGTTGSQTIGIHRITQNWTEGSGSGTAGIGAATADGATWDNRTAASTWSTPGGTFNGTATSSFTGVSTPATHTSGSLNTDVQDWVDGTANFGWLLRGNEGAAATAKRFFTSEAATAGNRPLLTVNFTRPLP